MSTDRLAPPRIPERLPYAVRLRTRWSDEDNQSVLNNAVYLTLLEEARHAYFSELGVLEGGRFPFLLAQSNLRFLRPGRGGAEVVVELATTVVGRTSLRQAYRVSGLEPRAAWCEAEALLVCYDPETLESRPWSADLRAALETAESRP